MSSLMGRMHADACWTCRRIAARARREGGQGTVEYVGLMLLVSLLMVGMVGAMTKFRGDQGTQLAEAIAGKIKQAVQKVDFR